MELPSGNPNTAKGYDPGAQLTKRTHPKDLGKVLTDLHEKPGQLRDILGGPGGQAAGSNTITDMLSSPMAKAVLAGIAAIVVKNMMGSSKRA